MIKHIVNVEQGGSMTTPQGQTLIQFRITTSDGEKFMTYLFSTIPPPKTNYDYNVEETGEVFWKWSDDKENKMYKKVKLTKVGNTTAAPNIFQQASPQSVQTPTPMVSSSVNNDFEYHKLTMDYLYKIGKLDLNSIYQLAPKMRQLMEGRLSPDEVGKLNLKFYPDNPFN